MHTLPKTATHPAAQKASDEAQVWASIAADWAESEHFHVWGDVPGNERSVVHLYDPANELQRRAKYWRYDCAGHDLADLALFSAGLAQAEADAWLDDRAHVATKAYEDRRFLLGDRILHWAVPWLEMISRWHPDRSERASKTQRVLLEIGETHRPAPAFTGTEGLVVPGFDGYGPLDSGEPMTTAILSVWSGIVISVNQLSDLRHADLSTRRIEEAWMSDAGFRKALRTQYSAGAHRWDQLAAQYPGSAQLWMDLAHRAMRTASLIT